MEKSKIRSKLITYLYKIYLLEKENNILKKKIKKYKKYMKKNNEDLISCLNNNKHNYDYILEKQNIFC